YHVRLALDYHPSAHLSLSTLLARLPPYVFSASGAHRYLHSFPTRRSSDLEATGEYVTVNDADDWSHAEKIATQVQYLIDYPTVIANTSEHARLTEEGLKLYRRGTPGKYIFPNMSSLMFRRKPV